MTQGLEDGLLSAEAPEGMQIDSVDVAGGEAPEGADSEVRGIRQDSGARTMVLNGKGFGDIPGTVTLNNGTPTIVITWKDNQIKVMPAVAIENVTRVLLRKYDKTLATMTGKWLLKGAAAAYNTLKCFDVLELDDALVFIGDGLSQIDRVQLTDGANPAHIFEATIKSKTPGELRLVWPSGYVNNLHSAVMTGKNRFGYDISLIVESADAEGWTEPLKVDSWSVGRDPITGMPVITISGRGFGTNPGTVDLVPYVAPPA